MKDETLLIKFIGNSPPLRIIDFFLDNRLFDYSKNEIIKNLNMSRTTFFKNWKELEKYKIVKVTRKIGKSKLYKLNEENDIVKKLILLDSVLSRYAMKRTLEKSKIKV